MSIFFSYILHEIEILKNCMILFISLNLLKKINPVETSCDIIVIYLNLLLIFVSIWLDNFLGMENAFIQTKEHRHYFERMRSIANNLLNDFPFFFLNSTTFIIIMWYISRMICSLITISTQHWKVKLMCISYLYILVTMEFHYFSHVFLFQFKTITLRICFF